MVVVKKSYRAYSEPTLVTFSTNFKTNLALSTVTFPTPPKTPAQVQTAIDDFETAAGKYRAERSSYNAGQTRSKRDLLVILDTQVEYVEETAPDSAAVESVYLEPAATGPSKAPLPGQPLEAGAKKSLLPQSVILYCKPVKLATSGKVTYFVFETNADGTEELRQMTSGTNSKKLEFGGLTTGHVYYFYIRAKTTAGFGPPSEVIRWVGQ